MGVILLIIVVSLVEKGDLVLLVLFLIKDSLVIISCFGMFVDVKYGYLIILFILFKEVEVCLG